jgi:HD-GYP domain-containing protein (c-di-GMP phosphodiesterase class II)
MTVDRPYSSAISFEAARDEIKRCAGSHFDPAVVNTFLTIALQTFADIRHRSLHDTSAADAVTEAVRVALGNSAPTPERAVRV